MPHPWQNRSPGMMRVPHLGQKFEARPGAGADARAGADAGAPWYADCAGAGTGTGTDAGGP